MRKTGSQDFPTFRAWLRSSTNGAGRRWGLLTRRRLRIDVRRRHRRWRRIIWPVPNAEVLTLIGTGMLAPHMALAHAATRPIRRINVFGRSPGQGRGDRRDNQPLGSGGPGTCGTGIFPKQSARRISCPRQRPANHLSCTAPGFQTARTSIWSARSRLMQGRPTTRQSPERAFSWTTEIQLWREAGRYRFADCERYDY